MPYNSPSDCLSSMAAESLRDCLCPMGLSIPVDLSIESGSFPAHVVFSFENGGPLYADVTSESIDLSAYFSSVQTVDDIQFLVSDAIFPARIVAAGHTWTRQGLDYTHLRALVVESEEEWPGYGTEFAYAQVLISGLPAWWHPSYTKVSYYIPANAEKNEILPFPHPNSPQRYIYGPSGSESGKAGLHLTACGWQVSLRELEDAVRNENKSVSYEGGITRVDKASFSLPEYRDFVRALEMFFSVIVGDYKVFAGNVLSQRESDGITHSSCRFRFVPSNDSYSRNPFGAAIAFQYEPLLELAEDFIRAYMGSDDFKVLITTFLAGQRAYNDGLGHYAAGLTYASMEALARIDGGKGKPVAVRYLESNEDEMAALPSPWGVGESAYGLTWMDLHNLRDAVAHGFATEKKVVDAIVSTHVERYGCLKLQRAMMALLICYLRRQRRG